MNINGFFKRKPAGTTSGGQFASPDRAEAPVVLTASSPQALSDLDEAAVVRGGMSGSDEPQDVKADLGVVRDRTKDVRRRRNELAEQIQQLEGSEEDWTAATVASDILKGFPEATNVRYEVNDKGNVTSVMVTGRADRTDGAPQFERLGRVSIAPGFSWVGEGPKGGQLVLREAAAELEGISLEKMHAQGAVVEPAAGGNGATVGLALSSVLGDAAKRVRGDSDRS